MESGLFEFHSKLLDYLLSVADGKNSERLEYETQFANQFKFCFYIYLFCVSIACVAFVTEIIYFRSVNNLRRLILIQFRKFIFEYRLILSDLLEE